MNNLPNANKTAILLVEDHPLTWYGLAACLKDKGSLFIAGTAATMEEGRRFITKKSGGLPGLVILDILLGTENGLEFIRFLREFCEPRSLPMPAVLVCSMYQDPFRVQTALQMGAAGYISKSADAAEILRAIDTVLSGGQYIDPRIKPVIDKTPVDVYDKFTRREREILILLKQNYGNQRIALKLGLSQRTVENHISHIYLKTGCLTRQELMDI
jgi:NarL family two-component system response regulator LiaR